MISFSSHTVDMNNVFKVSGIISVYENEVVDGQS